MSLLDSFLQRVEHCLRSPQETHESILTELRGHLEDRAEALVAAGKSPEQAERQAIREMGPVWLLSLRISRTHGWSMLVQVLREFWLAGVVLEVLWIPVLFIIALESCKKLYSEGGFGTFPGYWAWFISGMVILLASGFACSYALGRVVRGWAWILAPCLAITGLSISGIITGVSLLNDAVVGGFLFVAVIFTGAYLGCQREKPRLGWLAWAGFGAMLAWTVVTVPALLMISQSHGADVYRDNFSSWPITLAIIVSDLWRNVGIVQALQSYDAPFYILVVSLPWLCGLIAWLLGMLHRNYRLHTE
jgi:hypothetical protein